MSDEPDMTQSESESPAPKPTMNKSIAKWGTRGLIAGWAVGFICVLAAVVFDTTPQRGVVANERVATGRPAAALPASNSVADPRPITRGSPPVGDAQSSATCVQCAFNWLLRAIILASTSSS
jgi:hypothetical protein